MVVPVITARGFRTSSLEVLIERSYEVGPYKSNPIFDISPNGESVVMVKESESSGPAAEIRVITNWYEELERLAPTSGN